MKLLSKSLGYEKSVIKKKAKKKAKKGRKKA